MIRFRTLFVPFLLLVLAGQAAAHGDAQWIQDDPSFMRYQWPQHHFCSPDHCGVAPVGKFVDPCP